MRPPGTTEKDGVTTLELPAREDEKDALAAGNGEI